MLYVLYRKSFWSLWVWSSHAIVVRSIINENLAKETSVMVHVFVLPQMGQHKYLTLGDQTRLDKKGNPGMIFLSAAKHIHFVLLHLHINLNATVLQYIIPSVKLSLRFCQGGSVFPWCLRQFLSLSPAHGGRMTTTLLQTRWGKS